MAIFPAIKPNARSLTLGDYPQLSYLGPSGVGVRFLQNTKRVEHKLSLTYNSLTEAQITLILDHYNGQEGSLIPFVLPAEVWVGYSTVPVSSVDYEWRYASAFSVQPSMPGRFNVSIELESVIA
jgi:hypothetical protein